MKRACAVGLVVLGVLLSFLARPRADGTWDDIFFTHVVGDVVSAQVTPDGTRAVFLADLVTDRKFELFSVPYDGSASPIAISGPLRRFADVEDGYVISPDSQHVLFRADPNVYSDNELFCVPVDGSATRVNLSAPTGCRFVTEFTFTPDSTHVVFQGQPIDPAAEREMWCVSLDGSSAVEISGPRTPGLRPLEQWEVSPDSSRIVFKAVEDGNTIGELFGCPLDGSGPIVKLNSTVVEDGSVWEFALTPDGAHMVYRADQDVDNSFALYHVPIDGSAAATLISQPPVNLLEVESDWVLTSGGDVVYRADPGPVVNAKEIYRVPADGSAAPIRLTEALDPDEVCEDFVISPAGYVVYRADQDTNNVIELYSVPYDGSQTTVKLSGTMVGGGDVQFRYMLSFDGNHVAYRADQDVDNKFELYGAPVDGSAAAVKLNPTMPSNQDVPIQFHSAPGASSVVFNANTADEMVSNFWVAPFDGSSPALGLNAGGTSMSFRGFGAGQTVVCRGVLDPDDVDFVEELFVIPLDASAAPFKLHPEPVRGGIDGDILTYALSADGADVAYMAREKEGRALYLAPISDPTCPIRLVALDDPNQTLQISIAMDPAGVRAAFLWTTSNTNVTTELYTVRLDGSEAPVKISGIVQSGTTLQSDFQFTPDGTSLVYRADATEDDLVELWSAPSDGATTPTQLCGALVAGGDVLTHQVSNDGVHVVYRADQEVDNRYELYSVPVAGGSAPVKLNGVPQLGGRVLEDYQVLPDGSAVLYRADVDVAGREQLWVSPIDGSAPATELNDTLGSGGDVLDYKVSADGSTVVYRVLQTSSSLIRLFAVPSDGSAAPVEVNPAPVPGGNVGNYLISADGSRVVFDGDLATNNVIEAWSAPTDGSSTGIRLHAPLSSGQFAQVLVITPDGSRLVYLGSSASGSPVGLHTVPTDASSAPVLVHVRPATNQHIQEITVTPDSSRVVYRSDFDVNDVVEVFSAPTDGSAGAIPLSGRIVENGAITFPLTVTPDSAGVIFRGDKSVDEVFELFIAPTDGVLARGSGVSEIEPEYLHPPLAVPRPTPQDFGSRSTGGTTSGTIAGSGTSTVGP